MAPQIKHSSGKHDFNGDFVETILFADGNFVIMYNGISMGEKHYGRLPDDVEIDRVQCVRMATNHITPQGITCGPIAVFCLQYDRTLVYEFWADPKMNHATGTNGFWKTTNLKAGQYWTRIGNTLFPINVIETIDEEKSTHEVKVTKSQLQVGVYVIDSYDLN
jgi:hypothetical protein